MYHLSYHCIIDHCQSESLSSYSPLTNLPRDGPRDGANWGWNVFLRDHTKGKQLQPGDWTAIQEECRKTWAQMTPEEKQGFKIRADHEHHIRLEACQQPFRPNTAPADRINLGNAGFDAAGMLGRSALKRVAKHRCFASYEQYKQSICWEQDDAGLSTSYGALNLDLIDLESTATSLNQTWSKFANAEPHKDWFPSTATEIHNATCWANHGCCKKVYKKDLVERLVSSLAGHLDSGASPLFMWTTKLSFIMFKLLNSFEFGINNAITFYRRDTCII